MRVPVEERERVRPGMQPADQVVDARRRPAPVDDAVVLGQPMRVGGGAIVLRRLVHSARGESVDRRDEQPRAEPREVALDLVAGLVGTNRARDRRQHRAGVERLDDAHDRDARLALAGDDGAVHRRRAAIAGQQRRVDVDQAERAGSASTASVRILP